MSKIKRGRHHAKLIRDKEQFYTCAFAPGASSTTCFFLDKKYTCGYVLGALNTTAVSQPLTLTECWRGTDVDWHADMDDDVEAGVAKN